MNKYRITQNTNDAAIPLLQKTFGMGLGGSFFDPPGPLEDRLEDTLEENLEPPSFPPTRPPA